MNKEEMMNKLSKNPEFMKYYNEFKMQDNINNNKPNKQNKNNITENILEQVEEYTTTQLNIRDELAKIDKEDADMLGSLIVSYDYLEPTLSLGDKQHIAQLIINKNIDELQKFLDNKIDTEIDFDYEIYEEEI